MTNDTTSHLIPASGAAEHQLLVHVLAQMAKGLLDQNKGMSPAVIEAEEDVPGGKVKQSKTPLPTSDPAVPVGSSVNLPSSGLRPDKPAESDTMGSTTTTQLDLDAPGAVDALVACYRYRRRLAWEAKQVKGEETTAVNDDPGRDTLTAAGATAHQQKGSARPEGYYDEH